MVDYAQNTADDLLGVLRGIPCIYQYNNNTSDKLCTVQSMEQEYEDLLSKGAQNETPNYTVNTTSLYCVQIQLC